MRNDTMIARLLLRSIAYNAGDAKRIAHLVKVHGYARAIGLLEQLNETEQLTLEAAAVLHDIGIRICEQKYEGRCSGDLQEIEGPPIARSLMEELGFEADITDRVAFLVAHHHTYTQVDGIDYQILIESDFLVNFDEDGMSEETIRKVLEKIFKTKTGTALCSHIFLEEKN